MAADPTFITCPHCREPVVMTAMQHELYRGRTLACVKCARQFTVDAERTPLYALPPAGVRRGMSRAADPSEGIDESSVMDGIVEEPAARHGAAAAGTGAGTTASPGTMAPTTSPHAPSPAGTGVAVDGGGGGGGGTRVAVLIAVVVLILLGGVVAILVPARNRAQESAERLKCAMNLRQIDAALAAYAAANGGTYPDALEALVAAGQLATSICVCPSSGDTPAGGTSPQMLAANAALPAHQSYVYLGRGLQPRPGAQTGRPIVYEPVGHHRGRAGGVHVLYDNGAVAFLPAAQAAQTLGFQPTAQPPATPAGTAPQQ